MLFVTNDGRERGAHVKHKPKHKHKHEHMPASKDCRKFDTLGNQPGARPSERVTAALETMSQSDTAATEGQSGDRTDYL